METAPSIEEYEAAVAGMHMIGQGKDRIAFRMPDSKWVYKQQIYEGCYTNNAEFHNYTKLKDFVAKYGLSLPEMYLMDNGVIAAEFIDGERPSDCSWRDHDCFDDPSPDCWYRRVSDFSDDYGLYDCMSCNVRVVKSETGLKVYLIDLGE